MANIIKKGNTHRIVMCKHCECIFSYRSCETYTDREHRYINCPDCLYANIVDKEDKNDYNKEA